MTAGRCNETCMTGDGCTCQAETVADMNGAKFCGYTSAPRRGYGELVQDDAARLTLRRASDALSLITPEWRKQAFAEPDDGAVMADWPGGIGELHSTDQV